MSFSFTLTAKLTLYMPAPVQHQMLPGPKRTIPGPPGGPSPVGPSSGAGGGFDRDDPVPGHQGVRSSIERISPGQHWPDWPTERSVPLSSIHLPDQPTPLTDARIAYNCSWLRCRS